MSIWNGKYVSVNNIISKAYRDMGMQDSINIADAVEWCGEAIELIGNPTTLEEKVVVCEVSEYKVELPSDLHQIQSTWAYAGTVDFDDADSDNYIDNITGYTPMRYSGDVMHYYTSTNCSDTACSTYYYTYKVNNDYMYTDYECGAIKLSYWAIPTDCDGYPKIPDQIKFREAVSTHLAWKLARIKHIQGKMAMPIYMEFKQERDWYIGAAQNAGQMPGLDQMEALKNNWIRLIPKINQHRDGFKSAGDPEQRYTHNSTNLLNSNWFTDNNKDISNFFYYYNAECEIENVDSWDNND